MKNKKLLQIIMTAVSLAAVIVVTVVFTLSWYIKDVVAPYHFSIKADGILYVYVGSVTIDNDESLKPAVAMPGAVQEGLNYNVLEEYNQDDETKSYIESVASISNIKGEIAIYNEGYSYEKVPLPKDANGYTLFPLVNTDGKIVWADQSGESPDDWIWQTTTGPETDEFPTTETDYEPLLDSAGNIIWKGGYSGGEEWTFLGEEYWECKEVPTAGAASATVNFNMVFKASDDSDKEDFYSKELFGVNRIFFTSTPFDHENETAPSDSKSFKTLSSDKTMGSFIIYGSEKVYIHAEIYLKYPDELIDPRLRGQTVYIAVNLSVEVTVSG